MRLPTLFCASLLLTAPLLAEAGFFSSNESQKGASTEQDLPLDQRVELLERRMNALSNIVLRLDALQREVQQLRGDLEEQKHAMEAMKQQQRSQALDMDQRLGRISGTPPSTSLPPATVINVPPPAAARNTPPPVVSSSAPGAQPPPLATPGPQAGAGPQQEKAQYQEAFNLLMQRRYDEARPAFTAFLASYPDGELSDNAQYWLAESYYVSRDYDTALPQFNKVVENFPHSSKVPDAMLKIGFIQGEQQEWETARETLEQLIQRYPSSTASQLAKKHLDRMRSEGH